MDSWRSWQADACIDDVLFINFITQSWPLGNVAVEENLDLVVEAD